MNRRRHYVSVYQLFGLSAVLAVLPLAGLACGTPGAGSNNAGGSTSADGNVLLTEVLSYGGSASGTIFESQSTRSSLADTSAAQAAPPAFDTAGTVIQFRDLAGEALLDAEGRPFPPVTPDPDGTFTADKLPVGVDFAVCVDIDGSEECGIESVINIPGADGGDTGALDGVRVDPLTTLVAAKLRALLEEKGIDPADLPVSPAAVVTRIVDAYTHLFEESGIDHEVSLDDIGDITRGQLDELFDSLLPAGAQSGMQIVEGNLGLVLAKDVQEQALAAAEVFLRAGFPIIDLPGGLDLSVFAGREGIEVVAREKFFEEMDHPRDGPDDFPEGFPGEKPDDLFAPAEAEVIYVSIFTEPDRNFVAAEDGSGDEEGNVPPMPVINDHILLKMAELRQDGARVSLQDLYHVVTSLEEGLGARLTYFLFDPNFHGPPLHVFETADGKGLAISLERLFKRIFDDGFDGLGPEEIERREAELRAFLAEELGDTVPPVFERLFDALLSDRIEGAEALARRIRNARAHLPFNRFGPSAFFVVADGDPFRQDPSTTQDGVSPVVNPVTVDAEITPHGEVVSVSYRPDGNGRFLLGFTGSTDVEGMVELFVREAGMPLHGRGGPVRLNMHDSSVFEDVNGRPFIDLVSENGILYPGTHYTVVKDDYVPEGDMDRPGPHESIFVLATQPGPDAEPVRVDYDPVTGTATYDPAGRHLLMFLPESESTGLFALFNEDIGRPAGHEDPTDFFDAPPERPDGFEDFFNEIDGFEQFDDFQNIDDFIDENFPPRPGDGPGDGGMPPLDGEPVSPDDGTQLPPDVTSTGAPASPDVNTAGTPTDVVEPAGIEDEFLDPRFILVSSQDIVGLDIRRESFQHVFGMEVPNARYNPDGDPYYDDVNGNDVQDEGEPTAPFRPMLFDPHDWRSTDIRLYYRRADNGLSVGFEEIDFESPVPQTLDGVALVVREYKPRLNAFRFGRPNTAINLLTAFSPPELFDGTHALNADTLVDPFMAVALVNLVMDQVLNVEADIDIDGLGPAPRVRMLVDARMFVMPIGDPFFLLLDGMRQRASQQPAPQ